MQPDRSFAKAQDDNHNITGYIFVTREQEEKELANGKVGAANRGEPTNGGKGVCTLGKDCKHFELQRIMKFCAMTRFILKP